MTQNHVEPFSLTNSQKKVVNHSSQAGLIQFYERSSSKASQEIPDCQRGINESGSSQHATKTIGDETGNNSRLSSNTSSKIQSYCTMSRRRKSQGIELGSAPSKKDIIVKQPIFKVNHLPLIQNRNSSTKSEATNNSTIPKQVIK